MVVNTFLNVIKDELKNNNTVKLDGFGSFTVHSRKEYIGKNVNTGENELIPESKYVRFKPSKLIK